MRKKRGEKGEKEVKEKNKRSLLVAGKANETDQPRRRSALLLLLSALL
jgi:hypothetical protein